MRALLGYPQLYPQASTGCLAHLAGPRESAMRTGDRRPVAPRRGGTGSAVERNLDARVDHVDFYRAVRNCLTWCSRPGRGAGARSRQADGSRFMDLLSAGVGTSVGLVPSYMDPIPPHPHPTPQLKHPSIDYAIAQIALPSTRRLNVYTRAALSENLAAIRIYSGLDCRGPSRGRASP